MIVSSRQEPLTRRNADHRKLMDLWDSTARRLAPSRRRIAICQAIRRGVLTVRIPQSWLRGLEGQWLESAVPERWQRDLNLSNVIGEDEVTFTRTPLGSTDTAQEDADRLEAWVNAVERDECGGTDYDAMVGLAVQAGEWASLVLPTAAGMRRPPAYMEKRSDDGRGNATVRPRTVYDRDARGRPPEAAAYGGRSERQSRRAYDQAYERWMAGHPCWETRLISPTDCAPIMTRGFGRRRWECSGLVIRTRYEPEELLGRGWQWAGMGKSEMIPREYGTDSLYGDGGMVYLYEAYLLDEDERPFCVYSVGGDETWLTTREGEREATVDLYGEYGLDGKTWDYHYGLHFEDDPAYRGMPALWPLVPTLLNLESIRTAIGAAAWRNAFTGKIIRPDPNVPPTAYLDGHGHFKPWEDPGPGETKAAYGEITPLDQARVGEDAYRMLAEQRQSLIAASPDDSQFGGGQGASGHALVVGRDLLMSGKRQLRDGILGCAEAIVAAKLRIADQFHRPTRKGERPVDWPVLITEEELLPTGEERTKTTVLGLRERWVDGQYHLTASFPERGNLAEIEQEASLADRGYSHLENVLKKKGVRNVTIEVAKIMNYRYLMQDPRGQAELQIRAARYRGDVEREQLLQAVLAGEATPDGTPEAATEPGMGENDGPTQLPNMAASSRAGVIAGQMRTASLQSDAEAQMAVQQGMG